MRHGIKIWNHRLDLFIAIFFTFMLTAAMSVHADIIVYPNGQTVEGVIIEDTSEAVRITTAAGKISVPRSRIKDITRESPAAGWARIARVQINKESFDKAYEAARNASRLEPGNATYKSLIEEIQGRIAIKTGATREGAVSKVDALMHEADDLIKKRNFKDAEDKLKEAARLTPTKEQRSVMARQLSDFYLAWAKERLDKLDSTSAAEKLNLSLAANPENAQSADLLLKLWEKDSSKQENLIEVYTAILTKQPDDNETRQKLASLYYQLGNTENAAEQYYQLYHRAAGKPEAIITDRLFETLTTLHLKYARAEDYDKAIKYFNLLAQLDKQTNPSDVIFYEYAKKLKELDPKDDQGKLALAQEAEKSSMDDEALALYRSLLASPKVAKEARAGVERYATQQLSDARLQLNSGAYELASVQAEQIREQYKDFPEIAEAATTLIGQAKQEQLRDKREKREMAKDILEQANQAYNKAWTHVNNLYDKEQKDMPLLYNNRDMAKKYFKLAIDAYKEVLRIDPSQGGANSLVSVQLRESQAMLQRLSQSPTDFQSRYTPIHDD